MKPILNLSGARHAVTAKFDGARMFNEQGELNASNKNDALRLMAHLFNEMAAGRLIDETQEVAHDQGMSNRELVVAAYNDTDPTTWAELGALIAGRLTETRDREGFARDFLQRGEVGQGQRPRFEVDVKDTVAIKVVGPAQTRISPTRDKYIESDEFQIVANPFVAENDLNQGSGDLLDKAYANGLEQILRQEDISFVTSLRQASTVSLANNPLYMAGAFNSGYLTDLLEQVTRWNLTGAGMLMASDIMTDMQGQSGFTDWFDPVSKYELIRTGRIGSLLGMSLTTDAYRHAKLKVLNKGEVFVLASPEQLGGYTDRGPVQSKPIDQCEEGIIGKGWRCHETFSLVLHNAKAVSYARKF